MTRQKARLEKWVVVGGRLNGYVYDHPDWTLFDGEYIYTSTIIEIADDRKSAKTQNTDYTLGEPSDGSPPLPFNVN